MDELDQLRRERDEAFQEFVKHSSLSAKHTVKATAARKAYTLANDSVRALERDVLAYGPIHEVH